MDAQNDNTTSYNDFEKFIGHSEFARVLELAHYLKEQKFRLYVDGDVSTLPRSSIIKQQHLLPPRSPPPPPHEEEEAFPFDESAAYIRSTLTGTDTDTSPIIKRGMCAITDSLIDETIITLASELRLVLSLKDQMTATGAVSFSEDRDADSGIGRRSKKESKKQANTENPMKLDSTTNTKANANKFTKAQTDVLIDWLIENREHPFLSTIDIAYLTDATGLVEVQVKNFVSNSRKRNRKAIIENDKKPYHFLDYIFLATDREIHVQQSASADLKRNTLEDNDEESCVPNFSYPRPNYPDISPTRSPAMFREIFRHEDIELDDLDDLVRAKTPSSALSNEGSDSPFDENAADYASTVLE